VALVVTALCLAPSAPAGAASFTMTPVAQTTDGAGPSTWSFVFDNQTTNV
jgi:hypothetical protein